MERIDILEEDFDNFMASCKRIGYGTEAVVLSHKEDDREIVFKIFSRNTTTFLTKSRIRKLASIKELSDYVTIPQEEVYLDFKFVGYTMENGGLSLRDYIEDKNPSVDEKIDILKKAKIALEKLHSYNIIHGDIQASNILVNDENIVRITDINNIKYRKFQGTYLNKLSEYLKVFYGVNKELDIMCLNYLTYLMVNLENFELAYFSNSGNKAFNALTYKDLQNKYFDQDALDEQLGLIYNPSYKKVKKLDYLIDYVR